MSALEAYSSAELAPLLGIDARNVRERAKRESWQARPRRARGGGSEWLLASMPKATVDAILTAQLSDQGVALAPALTGCTAPAADPRQQAVLRMADLSQLTAPQRETVLARLAFVREIERLTRLTGKEKSIHRLEEMSKAGTLCERLAQLVPVANAKYGVGEGRGLSRRRLYEWCALYAEGGELALAPRTPQKDMSVPAWAPLFLACYQRPQNPSLAEAHRDFTRAWQAEQPSRAPSIDAVRRFLAKVAKPDLAAGRKTGNALLHLKPYLKRKTEKLLPCDVYTADGTTFDAEIQHPDTGRPFKPEVVLILDVATRRCVGISVALAESAAATLDALRMACLFGGIPAMFYTDNGPGYTAYVLTGTGTGMLQRLGIQIANAIPGRPQGKGLMERAVKTICVPAAKQLDTCTHADMDQDAAHKVFKITRAQLKKHGRSALLPTFETFKKVLLARVEEYNASPHRGLPSIEDHAAGKRRHMSPNEYWNHCLGRVFEPMPVPADMADDLFMPGTFRKVKNGMVRLWNRDYFAHELAPLHDEVVEVRYDIWDATFVTVWTEAGEKICRAELDANAMDYFPIPRIEDARAERERAQLKRLEQKAQRIAPGASITVPQDAPALMADSLSARQIITISAQPEPAPAATPAELERIRAVMAQAERDAAQAERQAQAAAAKRPIFERSTEKFRWLMRHQDQWTDADRAWLAEYVQGREYAMLRERFEYEGLALTPAQLFPALETPGL
ncbi:putative transposase [Humidesulfovibrio mexicanus]|uniref:Putative transposase n=1 Tax=Humidesulfovibrio mexicanus TaxID=147047 RepID=A0A239ALD7_9BACT|nr:Mu transposase C-terminal domain-containing protein [Humidesulfovibrio mexicanus]SNR95808.1 putative transposase [Humidesulfovibrio mexicanus]